MYYSPCCPPVSSALTTPNATGSTTTATRLATPAISPAFTSEVAPTAECGLPLLSARFTSPLAPSLRLQCAASPSDSSRGSRCRKAARRKLRKITN